jgi:hypothetical protein
MPVTAQFTAVGIQYIRYFFIPYCKGIRHGVAVAAAIAPVAVIAIPIFIYQAVFAEVAVMAKGWQVQVFADKGGIEIHFFFADVAKTVAVVMTMTANITTPANSYYFVKVTVIAPYTAAIKCPCHIIAAAAVASEGVGESPLDTEAETFVSQVVFKLNVYFFTIADKSVADNISIDLVEFFLEVCAL